MKAAEVLKAQVCGFDVGVVVLTFFDGRIVSRFNSLVRTGMETSETGSTVRADSGYSLIVVPLLFIGVLPFREHNITHRAHACAETATDTFVRVDSGSERPNHPFLHSLCTHEPGQGTPPAIVVCMPVRLDVIDDVLQA